MKMYRIGVTAAILAILVISCNQNSPLATNPQVEVSGDGSTFTKAGGGPVINAITPVSAEIGDLLTINGNNFGPSPGQNDYVSIMGIRATVYQLWSQTQIKVYVPSGAAPGSGVVKVQLAFKVSNTKPFTLLASTPVTIGNQIWMGSNLDVTTYKDGTPIPQVTDLTEWMNCTTGAWCYYNNDPANGPIYGKLYNWYAVNDPRGLAPTGWHIPSYNEWKTLCVFLGMTPGDADLVDGWYGTVEGGKLKEMGTSLWVPNTAATNVTGFTALPAGYRSSINGTFAGINQLTILWTSTPTDFGTAWCRGLLGSAGTIYNAAKAPVGGYSVRCVKD